MAGNGRAPSVYNLELSKMPMTLAGPSHKILQEHPTKQNQDSQSYICPRVKEISSVIKPQSLHFVKHISCVIKNNM